MFQGVKVLVLALWIMPPLGGYSQVLDERRDQPLDLNFGAVANCCRFSGSREVYECLVSPERMHAISENSANRVTLVSYSTDNILEYAGYAHAVTGAYAMQNQYSLKILTSDGGHNHEPKDPRWNKVKIMELFTDPNEKFGPDFVVWMDSDLIPLDLGLSIDGVMDQYPEAHVVLSSDPLPEEINSVANTGMMIARRSQWSKVFFSEWWNRQHRSDVWDQHVFTDMWKADFDGMRSQGKVALLRPDALNSWRPAAQMQKPYNQILHMIGSVPQHRRAVFERAWNAICDSSTSSSMAPLAPQLGLSREVLLEIETTVLASGVSVAELFLGRTEAALRIYRGGGSDFDRNSSVDATIRDLLNEWGIVRRLNEPDNVYSAAAGNALQETLKRGLEGLSQLSLLHAEAAATTEKNEMKRVESLQTALDVHVELAVLMLETGEPGGSITVLRHVLDLPDFLPKQLETAATYYRFKVQQLLATAESASNGQRAVVVQHWREAMRLLEDLRLRRHASAVNGEALAAIGQATIEECTSRFGDRQKGLNVGQRGLQLAKALRLQQIVPQEAVDHMLMWLDRCKEEDLSVSSSESAKEVKEKKTRKVYRRRKRKPDELRPDADAL